MKTLLAWTGLALLAAAGGCRITGGPDEQVVEPAPAASLPETSRTDREAGGPTAEATRVGTAPRSAPTAYQKHLAAVKASPLEPGLGVHAYQLIYVPRASKNRYVVRVWKDAEGYHYQSIAPGKARGRLDKPQWINFLRAIRSSGYWEASEEKMSRRPGSDAWIEAVRDNKHHLVHRQRPTGEFGRAVQWLFMRAAPGHGSAPVLQQKRSE